MLQRPGGDPRARNSSASQAGAPGAFASKSLSSDGALAIRQRMRAPLRFAWPPSRTSQQGVPLRSDATASRRVAVKSSARGSPQISPMTAEREAHLTPSSIAHSASRASRASTWMRFWEGSPGGWTRPLSRIAIRSCTQSKGLSLASCASRNPAHPPSRGCAANSSERVAFLPQISGGGEPCGGWWRGVWRKGAPPPHFVRFPFPANAGEDTPGAETAPPATRDKPFATRLTTLLFYFCSYLVSRDKESILRLGSQLLLFQERFNLTHDIARRALRNPERHMRAVQLDRLVALMLEASGGTRSDEAVLARPER